MNENADLVIANTLRIANEDLQGARVLATTGNRNAVYLLEQAAEKIIRAILTSENKNAGREHNLRQFVAQIPSENPLKGKLDEITELGGYATSFRYATPEGNIKKPPPKKQFDEHFRNVEDLLNQTAARFGVDLSKQNAPAGKPDPIR